MRAVYRDNGYHEVSAPKFSIVCCGRSRVTGKTTARTCSSPSPNRYYAVKPMNCPGHVQIYNANLHSYRDLPLRYGEFGFCHRNESSGALQGLMRVRGFAQDDGHIFCTEDQIQESASRFIAFARRCIAISVRARFYQGGDTTRPAHGRRRDSWDKRKQR